MTDEEPDPIDQYEDSDLLVWIVPGRRAVVRDDVAYERVIEAWINRLYTHRVRLSSWYFPHLTGGASDPLPRDTVFRGYAASMQHIFDGIYSVSGWHERFFAEEESDGSSRSRDQGTEVPVAADEDNTVDIGRTFFVRLWKGPLRILREEAARAPRSTVQLPPLSLDEDTREVVNANAVFIMGDVIEFPVHKFLLACGKTECENIVFNGEGSFFLGTSLKEGDESPPTSVSIHDNMAAMRFQLLLNAALGAFYSQSPVFAGSAASSGPQASGSGGSVYSRGLVYGATLLDPTERGPNDQWVIFTNQWGYRPGVPVSAPSASTDPVPANIPTSGSANYYPPTLPFTSAWSCSPCTLFLTYFIFNEYGYGSRSVANEYSSNPSSLPQSVYDRYDDDAAVQQFRLAHDPIRAMNVSDVFGDVNVIGFNIPPSTSTGRTGGHEIGIVRIWPHERLMSLRGDTPTQGFIAAYNPLNGESFFTNSNLEEHGQLYIFEASGSLGARSGGGQKCGANPFHWEVITDNTLHVLWGRAAHDPASVVHRLRMTDNPGSISNTRPPRYIREMFINKNTEPVSGRHSQDAEFYPLVIFHPVAGSGTWRSSARAILSDAGTVYADRAVPFPTMKEAEGGRFPQAANVRRYAAWHG